MKMSESQYRVIGTEISRKGEFRILISQEENNQKFHAVSFEVEVKKDYTGQPVFIVKADALANDAVIPRKLWLLETTDFNAAYDLKNNLCTMLGDPPNRFQIQHCTGQLIPIQQEAVQ